MSASYDTEPLAIGWTLVVAKISPENFQEFHMPIPWSENAAWTPVQPPNFTVPAGTVIDFVVEVAGVGLQGIFFGTCTEGSTEITGVSGASSLAVGQLIVAGGLIPEGSRIVSIAGTTIVFGNGEFDEYTNEYADPQGALANSGVDGLGASTVEDRPLGTVAAVISPDSGVTIVDTNADGTGNTSHSGDGTVIANLVGMGGGNFQVTFADTGTYSVGATFTPPADDSNFASAAATPITVTVT